MNEEYRPIITFGLPVSWGQSAFVDITLRNDKGETIQARIPMDDGARVEIPPQNEMN